MFLPRTRSRMSRRHSYLECAIATIRNPADSYRGMAFC